MSDLIGHDVGRYHIVERLGSGGMATVYRAYDARLERDVAIKFIRADVLSDELFLKRFEREAKALARLSHPNIVKVLDYGDHNGIPYLVMEFIRGDTLKSRLGSPIPWRQAARMLAPIAEALSYTHQQNIIHRDVKPSNLLVSDSGHLMLSDFGIAKILDTPDAAQLTGTGVGIGTPEYMAPEQGLGQPSDQRADIYSLGIVFYEMVTGQKPYRADTPMAVMLKHISDPLPSPRQYVPGLPENVERLLFKALAKNPAERYADMGSLVKALLSLAEVTEETATRMDAPQTYITPPTIQTSPSPITTGADRQTVAHPGQPTSGSGQPSTNAKKPSRLWVTCGIIAALLLCIITTIFAVTGGFRYLANLITPSTILWSVDIAAPAAAETGSEFEVTVTIHNRGDREATLREIVLPQQLLDAAELVSSDPPHSGSTAYTASQETGYSFSLPVPPENSREVRFRFLALQPADINTQLTVTAGSGSLKGDVRVSIVEAVAVQPTATLTASPTATRAALPDAATATPPAEWPLVWEDDFSDPESGFFVSSDADSVYEYYNGEYLVESRKSNWSVWMYLGYSLSNVQLNVDVRVDRGTGNGAYGVLCHFQNEGDYYGFMFSEDGYYTIWLRHNDEYTYLVPWTYDSQLIGEKTRRMMVTCEGNTLTLGLDGYLLATIWDPTLSYGDVGFIVDSYELGGMRTAFDNFELYGW